MSVITAESAPKSTTLFKIPSKRAMISRCVQFPFRVDDTDMLEVSAIADETPQGILIAHACKGIPCVVTHRPVGTDPASPIGDVNTKVTLTQGVTLPQGSLPSLG